jgi:hypothetical protein
MAANGWQWLRRRGKQSDTTSRRHDTSNSISPVQSSSVQSSPNQPTSAQRYKAPHRNSTQSKLHLSAPHLILAQSLYAKYAMPRPYYASRRLSPCPPLSKPNTRKCIHARTHMHLAPPPSRHLPRPFTSTPPTHLHPATLQPYKPTSAPSTNPNSSHPILSHPI